jgi:bacteriocin-like protein
MSDDSKIDPNKNPAEVPPKDAKTELTEEELTKVTGGGSAGVHYTSATLYIRKSP